jgi:hypothetical protein
MEAVRGRGRGGSLGFPGEALRGKREKVGCGALGGALGGRTTRSPFSREGRRRQGGRYRIAVGLGWAREGEGRWAERWRKKHAAGLG